MIGWAAVPHGRTHGPDAARPLLMKQKKGGKIASKFTSPEKDFIFIYDVIVKPKKRNANHYLCVLVCV